MTDFIDAFRRAVGLIVTLDPSLVEILVLSLKVSLSAVAIASLLGFAIGGALAVYRFPGRGGVSAILSALMGLPPVVAGLMVYLLLSNVGPLRRASTPLHADCHDHRPGRSGDTHHRRIDPANLSGPSRGV